MSRPTGEQPLVSVVTPVYNGERYLEECIESVLAQTYDHWEYVVVDNCSTDRTPEIAAAYAERDARIRVVRPDEFVDAGANANRALREISRESRYCKVLHADDWLFPECLERMVRLAEENPSVGIVSSYRLEGERVSLVGLPYAISVLPGPEICRSTLLGSEPYPYLFGSPTSLLLRSDLVRARETFYNPENPYQDDQEACYELLRTSDFGFVHQVLTFTRRHEGAGIAYFHRVGGEIPGQISLLRKFGPVYLDAPDYRRRLATLVVRHGLFLALNLARLRDPEYRRHQADALASLCSLDPADLRAGIGLQLRRMIRRRRVTRG